MITYNDFYLAFFPDGRDKDAATELFAMTEEEIAEYYFQQFDNYEPKENEVIHVEELSKRLLQNLEEDYTFQYFRENDTGYEYFEAV